jgi:molybdopterin-guanine dinucleotide biosynthesis protein A
MNSKLTKAGVILAGGQGRRMDYRDKGLVYYRGQTLVSYAIAALRPVVGQVLISANRHHADYQKLGFPVIADACSGHFDGPLAGILAAMQVVETESLLVMPCDTPLVQTQHLTRLMDALLKSEASIAVASSAGKLQPVFLALNTQLKSDLADFLNRGQRKITDWLAQHSPLVVDFSHDSTIFLNLNTLDELRNLEQFNKE